jgi:hypothetical protein
MLMLGISVHRPEQCRQTDGMLESTSHLSLWICRRLAREGKTNTIDTLRERHIETFYTCASMRLRYLMLN